MLTLDAILAPLGRAEFIRHHWNTSFARIPGTTGKFGSLLSWEDLNHILERHRLEPPRFSLVLNGKTLDASRYLLPDTSGPRLNAGGLTACLAQGATLVLDDVDEMAPEVRTLAESCEDVLQARVTVNLYGSWRTQKGFALHWDTQDTLILQVSGRKQWTVYRPTREHPLEVDVRDAPRPADADLMWEGMLEDGDVLYLPRGWWHVASAVDEPSLHLTVTIVPPRAIEFLHWLADQARGETAVRMDIPRLRDEDEQRAFTGDVVRAVMAAATPDALGRFLEWWDSGRRSRLRLRLPDLASANGELGPDTRVRLGQARRIAVTPHDDAGVVELHARGHRWTGDADLVPALRRLSSTESLTVAELCSAVPPGSARSLKAMLTALVMIGVVVVD